MSLDFYTRLNLLPKAASRDQRSSNVTSLPSRESKVSSRSKTNAYSTASRWGAPPEVFGNVTFPTGVQVDMSQMTTDENSLPSAWLSYAQPKCNRSQLSELEKGNEPMGSRASEHDKNVTSIRDQPHLRTSSERSVQACSSEYSAIGSQQLRSRGYLLDRLKRQSHLKQRSSKAQVLSDVSSFGVSPMSAKFLSDASRTEEQHLRQESIESSSRERSLPSSCHVGPGGNNSLSIGTTGQRISIETLKADLKVFMEEKENFLIEKENQARENIDRHKNDTNEQMVQYEQKLKSDQSKVEEAHRRMLLELKDMRLQMHDELDKRRSSIVDELDAKNSTMTQTASQVSTMMNKTQQMFAQIVQAKEVVLDSINALKLEAIGSIRETMVTAEKIALQKAGSMLKCMSFRGTSLQSCSVDRSTNSNNFSTPTKTPVSPQFSPDSADKHSHRVCGTEWSQKDPSSVLFPEVMEEGVSLIPVVHSLGGVDSIGKQRLNGSNREQELKRNLRNRDCKSKMKSNRLPLHPSPLKLVTSNTSTGPRRKPSGPQTRRHDSTVSKPASHDGQFVTNVPVVSTRKKKSCQTSFRRRSKRARTNISYASGFKMDTDFTFGEN